MVHTVRLLPRRRRNKERFLVHFFAYDGFDLLKLLAGLQTAHAFEIHAGKDQSTATIKIIATARQLRKLLETVPSNVQFGYEVIKEPEKC